MAVTGAVCFIHSRVELMVTDHTCLLMGKTSCCHKGRGSWRTSLTECHATNQVILLILSHHVSHNYLVS